MSLQQIQTIEEPVSESSKRVLHWFPGYGEGGALDPPPIGAVSACGYVRRSGSLGRTTHFGDPDACVVCHDLWLQR